MKKKDNKEDKEEPKVIKNEKNTKKKEIKIKKKDLKEEKVLEQETNKKEDNNPKKKKWLKFLLIILVIIVLIGLTLYIYFTNKIKIDAIKKENQSALRDYNIEVEYLSKWKYEEMVINFIDSNKLSKDTKIKILVNNKELKKDKEFTFDKVGEVKITILLTKNYQYDITKFIKTKIVNKKEYKLAVMDTKFPVLNGVKDKTITVGDKLNITEGITATDEMEGQLKVEVEGNVDTNKVGTYKVKVYAVDKNGNKTEKEMTITVNEKSTSYGSGSSYNPSSGGYYGGGSSGGSSSSGNDASTQSGRLALARQEARRVVARIINAGMTTYEKAEAICMYITNTVAVQYDQSLEAYQTNYGNEAYAALIMKIAACSGRCKAVMLLCEAAGLQCQHVNANQWSHQWNRVLVDGKWITIDSQIGFIGDKHPLED